MTNEELINVIRREIQSQNANFTIMAQGMNEVVDAVRKLTQAKEQGPSMILLEESKVRETVEDCITDSFIARNLNVTTHASAEIGQDTKKLLSYIAARLEVALDAQSDAIKTQTVAYENARRPLFDKKRFRWLSGMFVALIILMGTERVLCPDVWCHRAYDAAKGLEMDAGATYVKVREAFNREEKIVARSETRTLEKQRRLRIRFTREIGAYFPNYSSGFIVTNVLYRKNSILKEYLVFFEPVNKPECKWIAFVRGNEISFTPRNCTDSFSSMPDANSHLWLFRGNIHKPYVEEE